ncbi:MAG: PKD domain-containing protein, partial [Flavobacteriales bacterium]|nr:PKD domain-containing protein [Flavobacteriales bacterium]
ILGSPLPAIQFADQSQGGATYWFWDFGDGSTSFDQNPLHVYSSTGSYVVCLTVVTANQGCQSTFCDTVVVGSNSGGCNAGFSNSGPTPVGYTFSAYVQDPNLNYIWTIDNAYLGNGYEAYAPGLSNGVHTICLTIVDSLQNCTDTQCQTITVGNNNCYGYISGQVYAGTNNQPLFNGVVYLITFDPSTNLLTAVDSIVLDTSNSFFFGPLACGDYLIKAAAYSGSPYYSNYIPTYHGNSPFWGFAQTITLGQVNQQVTADVTLIAANNPGGPGFIGGDVTQGANKTDPGDPLGGMEVLLFDMNGAAIAYTYTDQNGEFGFGDLAWGTYQVYVEALGVQTIPAVVTIGPNEPSVDDVHIFASESLISTGITEVDYEGAISDVYPNPVVNEATVEFNLEVAKEVNVSVLDLTGRMISTETASLKTGNNTLKV